MPKLMISELVSGASIDEIFLVKSKDMKTTRNGQPYIQLELMDRSGAIYARMWDAKQEVFESFGRDDFVKIKGKVESYQDRLQIIFYEVAKADESQLRLRDFLPQTQKDIAALDARLNEVVDMVADPHISQLLHAFVDDETFRKRFRTTPAATSFHHAYLGGLLEHTVSLLDLALKLVEEYEVLRKDIMIAGVFLHDIGKTQEISYARSFQYTDQGELVGHLTIGILMLEDRAKQIADFPPGILDVLRHIILSHHGELEWGSPKAPMIAEAIAIHYIDNLDAKLFAFKSAVESDTDPNSNWTEYVRMLGRKLYKR